MTEQHPHRPDLKRDLARIRTEYGKGLLSSGRNQPAIETIAVAVQLLEELVAQYPENPEYQLDLARTYEEWGCAHRGAVDNEAARRSFENSCRHYTILLESGPRNPVVLAGMAYALGNWGAVLAPEAGLGKWREALGIWEELVQRHPGRSSYRKSMEFARMRVEQSGEKNFAKVVQKKNGVDRSRSSPSHIRNQRPEFDGSEVIADAPDPEESRIVLLDARDRAALIRMAGRMAVVTGRIDHVKLEVGDSQWSFLNFSRTRKEFYGAIHRTALPDLRSEFGDGLEQLLGRDIELSGVITIHKGAPSIVLTRASQLRLMSANGE